MKHYNRLKHRLTSSFLSVVASWLAIATAAPLLLAQTASAAVQNPAPTAKISFTFDDGYTSAITQAQPTLAKYGLVGTDYVITGCVGMTTAPNTCRPNNDATYMSWTQVGQLKTAGWEIASHTVTHPYLATSDATDGQPNVLTPQQVATELSQSKSTFASHGITTTDFATPYGDYNPTTLAAIAKQYASHRGFADQNNNVWPYNELLLNDMPVQAGVTVAQVEAKIDQAIANKYWLVLTMHDIKTNPSTNPDDYEYSTANLDTIAAYVKAKQDAGLIKSVTVSQGPVTSDTNMFPNATFDSGIGGGWTTDNASAITANAASNGSYPSPTNSVRLTSAAANAHLFSPQVAVNPNSTYLIKTFMNVQAITSGEVGFYVDEYDSAGNWISGQYKPGERSVFVENLNFTYKPTSTNVAKARLQIITTGGSGITAYVDNVQMFALDNNAPPPPPPPPTNLMTNGTFDAGMSGGWRTDDTTGIIADGTSNGSPSNPVNSIKLTSTTRNTHLFSPLIAVDATKTYTLTNYLRLNTLSSGEVGFYVDEYDASGNWISGQYKTGVRAVSTGDVSFSYKPTSTNVKQASLQVILMANSGAQGYFDDARWFAQ